MNRQDLYGKLQFLKDEQKRTGEVISSKILHCQGYLEGIKPEVMKTLPDDVQERINNTIDSLYFMEGYFIR